MKANSNLWIALATSAMGLLVMLIGLRVIPASESDFNAPHWVVTAAGLVFLCGGLAVGFGSGKDRNQLTPVQRAVVDLCGLAIIAAFAAILSWIGFGPGERHFEGGVPFIGAEANAKLGRVLFGGFGVLAWIATAAATMAMLQRWRRDAAAA